MSKFIRNNCPMINIIIPFNVKKEGFWDEVNAIANPNFNRNSRKHAIIIPIKLAISKDMSPLTVKSLTQTINSPVSFQIDISVGRV